MAGQPVPALVPLTISKLKFEKVGPPIVPPIHHATWRFVGHSQMEKPQRAPDGGPLNAGSIFEEADTGRSFDWDGALWESRQTPAEFLETVLMMHKNIATLAYQVAALVVAVEKLQPAPGPEKR